MMNTIHVVVILWVIFNSELGTAFKNAGIVKPDTTTPTTLTTTSPATPTTAPTTTPTPPPPPFHQGPQYTINCLETGNIEVKGVPASTSLTVENGPASCIGNNTFPEKDRKIKIPTACLSDQNFTKTRSVTFTIHDSTFDGKLIATPNPSVKGLNGGQNLHRITVHCKSLPDSGMNVYVVHGVGLATPEPYIPTEIQKVEMRLKSEKYDSYSDVTELPDVSTVYIGDKFYMYLVYLGKDQYRVIPTECKAFDGSYASEPSKSVPKLDLYTNTSCLTKHARDYRVMQPFHVLKNEKRIVSAEMYGFLFDPHKEITFVCTVNICKEGGNCKLPSCTDWTSRRRRSAGQDKQFTITKRLRVQRKTVQNSAGFIKSSCFCVILLQLFTRIGSYGENES